MLSAKIGHESVRVADFTHLPGPARFLAFMPQWEFLDFLSGEARKYPTFHLAMKCEVESLGAPIDVLWMKLSCSPFDPAEPFVRFGAGYIFIAIDREHDYQCGLVIVKGSFDAIQSLGLDSFRARIAAAAPRFAGRVAELATWDDVKLLTVAVDRLRHWAKPGLLCIGDAAHAMSPLGGVGINLAIQDAVATANILSGPLREGTLSLAHLEQVQRRRLLPTRVIQRG